MELTSVKTIRSIQQQFGFTFKKGLGQNFLTSDAVLSKIVEAVKATLDKCPPDLAADLIDRGIMLAGGGAMLAGLDKLLSEKTSLPVFIAENPLDAVAKGTGVMLQGDNIWL